MSADTGMILHTLPLDVLLHVFRFLAIDDILSMRAVSIVFGNVHDIV